MPYAQASGASHKRHGNMDPTEKTHAVVVTYFPKIDDLKNELAILTKQVSCTWLIDNGSEPGFQRWLAESPFADQVKYIPMASNVGIAKAQNAGIISSINAGADYVLLMDQDSQPSTFMVEALRQKAKELPNVAAVGPKFLDHRRKSKGHLSKILGRETTAGMSTDLAKPVTHLISSGCLIPVPVLKQVGYMREELFIDYVDIEWCFRARAMGFQSYEISNAHMSHQLGDEPLRFLGKTIASHSPLRHYYQFRNALLVYRNSTFPLSWKIKDAWYMTQKFLIFALLAKPRENHLKMIAVGLWHGMLNKSGEFSDPEQRLD
jgi:rhamnosyltransferase